MISLLVVAVIFLLLYRFVTRDLVAPIFPFLLFLYGFLSAYEGLSRVDGYVFDYYSVAVVVVSFLALFLMPLLVSLYLWPTVRDGRCERYHASTFFSACAVLSYLFLLALYLYVEFLSSPSLCPLCDFLSGAPVDYEKIHRFGKDAKLQLFVTQFSVVCLLFVPLLLSSSHSFVKFFIVILLAVPIVLGVIKTSKSDIIFPLIMYSVLYYMLRGKSSLDANRYYLLGAVLVVSLLVFMVGQRVEVYGGVYSKLIGYDDSSDVFGFSSIVYGYISASFLNFIAYLQSSEFVVVSSEYFGYSFFRPLYTLTLQGDAIAAKVAAVEFPVLGPGATVATYMRSLYLEGGLALLFVGSFVYSWLIAIFYFMARRSENFFYKSCYAILYVPWIMMFFQNLFANLNFYLSIFVMAAFSYMYSSKKLLLVTR